MVEGKKTNGGPVRLPSPSLSSHDGEMDDHHLGDYSTRMEELFGDENDAEEGSVGEDEEEFVYDGVDAEQLTGATYRQQLREVLGSDNVSDQFEEEVEMSLLYDPSVSSDEAQRGAPQEQPSSVTTARESSPTLSPSPLPPMTVTSVETDPNLLQPSVEAPQPFVHPAVSRLRSFLPKSPAQTADSSLLPGTLTPLGHHSPQSHTSNLSLASTPLHQYGVLNGEPLTTREAFKWTVLHNVNSKLFGKRPSKAAVLLGASSLGSPTVLSANGLICVGTDAGRILVFDFKQKPLCVCGNENSASTVGPISALALSYDHTYVAAGHVSGHIQLFDLKNPHTPVRAVSPASPQLVLDGRQEGHLPGSRIVSISFVAGRHTAIVSADEHGLAFYHSLGKVLFVEASDTVRILGNYPEERFGEVKGPGFRSFRRQRVRRSVLAMATLPLGGVAHPTDAYQLVAMLTPTMLVIVGLRPIPKTWLKRQREDPPSTTADRRRATLAWFPSMKYEQAPKDAGDVSTAPILAYSWGKVVRLLRVSEKKVKQVVSSPRSRKSREVELGTLVFEDFVKWVADDTVLALQWLNANQLLVFTATALEVYDIRTAKVVEHGTFDASALLSPTFDYTTNGTDSHADYVCDVAHSVRAYRGTIFLLERQQLRVGTLLTWADKVLSFVEKGDFLNAIELTRTYYTDEAPGNRNGLPDDPQERGSVLGRKLSELMVASARYAFSGDRMTDGTHFSPDGRGVDRTSVFEGLVATCARACIAFSDYNFLFEDLFHYFQESGISRIYLEQLEPFVLDGTIRSVPPRITQRLVALHDADGHPDLAERMIWHIDPACLDINQAIRLCQTHQLWDALIYTYTRALHDYVSPIVELLVIIRNTVASRRRVATNSTTLCPKFAYKIFPYLIYVLNGQSYPSGEPLEVDEAREAMKDVYRFIFSGRSAVWPEQGGSLILASDDGEAERTYPYVRLLLRFDAESFLHCLDIGFENSFFSDETHDISRLWIITILLDVVSDSDLTPVDTTFVHIFVARNVPKYTQDIMQPPSVLQNVLISLATSMDPSTREDRQLAAEYLLSAYTPHDTVLIMRLFEDAGFYRILQHWHRRERQWTQLLRAYLQDPSLDPVDVFRCIDEVLALSMRDNRMTLRGDMLEAMSDALGTLLQSDLRLTAILVDKFAPTLHQAALDIIGDDRRRYDYLLRLLDPQGDGEDSVLRHCPHPSRIDTSLRQLFVTLQCCYTSANVIETLDRMRSNVDWSAMEQICETNGAYGAALWAMSQRGLPQETLTKAENFERRLTRDVVRGLAASSDLDAAGVAKRLDSLLEIGRRGAAICLDQSAPSASTDVSLEDIWFQLLKSQLHSVHAVSALWTSPEDDGRQAAKSATLSTLRGLVQETFASFVTISSTQAVSFPRLFKRLVDPGLYTGSSSGTPYAEFRTILTGMLESYRTDEDMLVISQHLLDRDAFDMVEEYAKEKKRGVLAQHGICGSCRKPLLPAGAQTTADRVVLSRTVVYHSRCSP